MRQEDVARRLKEIAVAAARISKPADANRQAVTRNGRSLQKISYLNGDGHMSLRFLCAYTSLSPAPLMAVPPRFRRRCFP